MLDHSPISLSLLPWCCTQSSLLQSLQVLNLGASPRRKVLRVNSLASPEGGGGLLGVPSRMRLAWLRSKIERTEQGNDQSIKSRSRPDAHGFGKEGQPTQRLPGCWRVQVGLAGRESVFEYKFGREPNQNFCKCQTWVSNSPRVPDFG